MDAWIKAHFQPEQGSTVDYSYILSINNLPLDHKNPSSRDFITKFWQEVNKLKQVDNKWNDVKRATSVPALIKNLCALELCAESYNLFSDTKYLYQNGKDLKPSSDRIKINSNYKKTIMIPKHIEHILTNKEIPESVAGSYSGKKTIFTDDRMRELEEKGFIVIPDLLDVETISLIRESMELIWDSEHITPESHKALCSCRGNSGILLKPGWPKMYYVNPANRVLSQDPMLVKAACELLGKTRITTNFYETKISLPDPDAPKNFGESAIEFCHVDCNYHPLLYLKQQGVNLDNLFYQMIISLTPMKSEEATVRFVQGSHKTWDQHTKEALQNNTWNHTGWSPCDPRKGWSEAGRKFIAANLVPVSAPLGSVVFFHPTVIHMPNLNAWNKRMAAYVYLGPHVTEQPINAPTSYTSIIPNSPLETRDLFEGGGCHSLASHPYVSMAIPPKITNFYPTVPNFSFQCTEVGECIFNFKSWAKWEDNANYKLLFGLQDEYFQNELQSYVKLQQDISKFNLHQFIGKYRDIATQHFSHLHAFQDDCQFCQQILSTSDEEYLHSTTYSYHRFKHNDKNIDLFESRCPCNKCANFNHTM